MILSYSSLETKQYRKYDMKSHICTLFSMQRNLTQGPWRQWSLRHIARIMIDKLIKIYPASTIKCFWCHLRGFSKQNSLTLSVPSWFSVEKKKEEKFFFLTKININRVTHRMWSYESESAHILLFKILSLISRIKKKLCIHHECEVFLYQMGHSWWI